MSRNFERLCELPFIDQFSMQELDGDSREQQKKVGLPLEGLNSQGLSFESHEADSVIFEEGTLTSHCFGIESPRTSDSRTNLRWDRQTRSCS